MTAPHTSLETKPFYRSAADEAAVHALYDEARAALPFPTEERTVPTRLGSTHLLVAGPEGAPDVVVLQGGNMVSPLTTAWLAPLADRIRIWAPDTPGQPGRSEGVRPVDGAARATLRVLTGGPDPDPLMVRATSLAFGGTELDTRTPEPATREQLAGLTSPVLVMAGERDPMFPASRVLPRARELFPELAGAEAIPGAHLQGSDGVRRLGERLGPFLLGGTG